MKVQQLKKGDRVRIRVLRQCRACGGTGRKPETSGQKRCDYCDRDGNVSDRVDAICLIATLRNDGGVNARFETITTRELVNGSYDADQEIEAYPV